MKLTRRKLLIAAAAGLGGTALPLGRNELLSWSGVALGADAEIRFSNVERPRAQALLAEVLSEVERLENMFSLYRPQSELMRLNTEGALRDPSQDMRLLLQHSLAYWQGTEGAFNPALQPVWTFLSRHFAATRKPPPPHVLSGMAAHCDPTRIDIGSNGITLGPGMALSFNGIAQGYITDRAAEIIRSHGLADVLVNLGEHRALPGKPWEIAVEGCKGGVTLVNAAIAQSSGRGTPFTPDGRWHHLIDPRSGASANRFKAVTVKASAAMAADALSTALFVSAPATQREIVGNYQLRDVFFELPVA